GIKMTRVLVSALTTARSEDDTAPPSGRTRPL
ncbi:hypothetical protein LSAT2_011100, partial [Lamellibrachia satsuma]